MFSDKTFNCEYVEGDIIKKSNLKNCDAFKHVNSISKYYIHTVQKHMSTITRPLNVRALHSLVLHMA